jgi:predicted deacylase
MTGLFEPSVKLGQKVAIGDAIGRVSDPPGEHRATVESQQEGIVLCLRAFAHVKEGDSLAVILEWEGMGT